MTALVALIVWRLSPFIVLPAFVVFAALDGVFLSSALTKVPQGAWFTLLLACLLSMIFILWRFGKEQQWKAEASDRFQPSALVSCAKDDELALTESFGGESLSRVKGAALFFDKAGELTPTVFIQFLTKFLAVPELVVFFHLRPLPMPTVPPGDRYTVTATSIPDCYRLVIRHGYTDEVISADLAGLVLEQIRGFVARGGGRSARRGRPAERRRSGLEPEKPALPDSPPSEPPTSSASSSTPPVADAAAAKTNVVVSEDDNVGARLKFLDAAAARQTIYIVGKEQMRIRPATNVFRRAVLRAFLWLRENSRTKMAALKIPTDKLVEVGFVKEV